ncbi:MAG: hypothetical protein ACYCS1_07260 [Gammaproteobacteria bacterium]
MRKRFSREIKAEVALEALRGEKTAAQLSSQYGVHATPINAWKKRALEELPELFGHTAQRDRQAQEAERDRLYQQIGKLQVQVEWLKKVHAAGLGMNAKRAPIEPAHAQMSLRRQCTLLGLNRASWYAQAGPPVGAAQGSGITGGEFIWLYPDLPIAKTLRFPSSIVLSSALTTYVNRKECAQGYRGLRS